MPPLDLSRLLSATSPAGSLKLVATSAARSTDYFHEASTTLLIAAAANCPGSTCPGAPPAAAAAAAPPAAATAGASNKSSTSGCPPSSYGYSCSVAAGDGATLHFAMGGADPPSNPCTAATPAANKLAASDLPAGALPVHFLLESPVGGYAGLGFPKTKGVMVPADAVIGYVEPATGRPVVSATERQQ